MDNTNDIWGGSGFSILILFFLIFGFGGMGGVNSGYVTKADLADSQTMQNLQYSISSVKDTVANGFSNQALAMNNGFNNVQGALCSGFAGVSAGLADLGYKMQNCCCELKTAFHAEGESTRALIQANTIQDLRDRLQDEKNERLATGIVTANTIQTNNIENFIRSFSNSCGC